MTEGPAVAVIGAGINGAVVSGREAAARVVAAISTPDRPLAPTGGSLS